MTKESMERHFLFLVSLCLTLNLLDSEMSYQSSPTSTRYVLKRSGRPMRALIPCSKCTILNKNECCQKYQKCCPSNIVPEIKLKQADSTTQQQIVVTHTIQEPSCSAQFANGPKFITPRGFQRIGSCPLRSHNFAIHGGRTQCNNNRNSCNRGNSRCCSGCATVMCCRTLDARGHCPFITRGCCQRCNSDNDCSAGKTCCLRPIMNKCCGSSCTVPPTVIHTVIEYGTEIVETVLMPATVTLPPIETQYEIIVTKTQEDETTVTLSEGPPKTVYHTVITQSTVVTLTRTA